MRPPPPLPAQIVAAFAAHPARALSSRALGALGCSSHDLTALVRGGVLERVIRGWYRMVGDAVPALQAALVRWGHLADLQPRSPLAVSGLMGLVQNGLQQRNPRRATFLVEPGRRVRLPADDFRYVERTDLLAPLPNARKLWAPPPADCLVDAVEERDWTDDQLRALCFRVINECRTTPAAMRDAWAQRLPQQVGRLEGLLADGSLQFESPAERRTFLDILVRHPPAPDCQVWLTPGRRVDYVYLFAALVLQYHGIDAHRDRVEEDAIAAFELAELGYDTLVITKSLARDPVRMMAHIHERRSAREGLFLAGRLPRPSLPVQPDRLQPLRTLHPLG